MTCCPPHRDLSGNNITHVPKSAFPAYLDGVRRLYVDQLINPKEDKMTAILHPIKTYHPTNVSLDGARLKARIPP
jgi:hypothetical protein